MTLQVGEWTFVRSTEIVRGEPAVAEWPGLMHAVTIFSLLLLTDRSTQPATCLIDISAWPLIGDVGKIVQLAAQSQEYPRLSIHGSISRKQRKSPIALSTINSKGESERRPRLGARASGPHAFHPAGNIHWASIPQDQRLRQHQRTGLPTYGRRAGRRPAHPGSLASPVGAVREPPLHEPCR